MSPIAAVSEAGIAARAAAASATPSRLPVSEQHDLQHVGGQHLAGRRAQAQDRDAADLLADEHPRDAPHADAAEDDDDEADQAEIVPGALEILADLVLVARYERTLTN
jgi:hypothetical protein